MSKMLVIVLLLFQIFFVVPQNITDVPNSQEPLEEQRLDTKFAGDRGFTLWYDAEAMEPVFGDYAYDVFLPLDGDADAGVSFTVYEIGYDNIISLPCVQRREPCSLDVSDPDGLYSADEAFPVLTDALTQVGYVCITEETSLSPDVFGTAYALFEKDGVYIALHAAELASGAFLMVLTYPEDTEDTWGIWLEEMAGTFSAAPGV